MNKNKNKIFLLLNKKEIIYYCLKTFQEHKKIDQIIVAAPKNDIAQMQKILNKYNFDKIIAIVAGGKERQDSAYNGLKFIKQHIKNSSQDIILFHNAANPFVSKKEIDQLIIAAKKYGASVVGQPLKDTIKQIDKNQLVIKTIPRQNLWAVQTPQVIKLSLAWQAFNQAEINKFSGTDDVSLVEQLGRKVKIIPTSDQNFKITTTDDLNRAKKILN